MENASKALIIAGSVLISILLISVGILIFNTTREIDPTDSVNQMAIQQFNGNFEEYESTNLSATQTKALIRAINSNNATAAEQITLTGITTASAVQSNKTYKVTLTYHSATCSHSEYSQIGYICGILIEQN